MTPDAPRWGAISPEGTKIQESLQPIIHAKANEHHIVDSPIVPPNRIPAEDLNLLSQTAKLFVETLALSRHGHPIELKVGIEPQISKRELQRAEHKDVEQPKDIVVFGRARTSEKWQETVRQHQQKFQRRTK